MHWMEDVALVDGWMMCIDDIHPPPPWKPFFTLWMLGLLDDDVMLGFDGDDWGLLPLGEHMM
jgi:hypothetical protein